MLKRNKLPFWKLCIVFGTIVLLTMGSFGSGQNQENGMMNGSMGNMMQSMNLNNITIQDLIKQYEPSETVISQSQEHSSHHSESGTLTTIHDLAASTIVLFLPLVIAGTLFLTIIWLGTSKRKGEKNN